MDHRLDRRQVLGGVAALATSVAASQAMAAPKHSQSHHGEKEHESLVGAAHSCVSKGEACMDHCLAEFRAGNSELAECAAAVQQMLATCRGLGTLAAHNSKHLARYASACIDICRSCEEECRKHADEHPACRECADACEECIGMCEKIAATLPASVDCA